MTADATEDGIVPGFDGTPLAWTALGEGSPVVLLHGYMSDARTNWLRYGHAAAIARRGFRVVMPDLRGHGRSGRPHDPGAYPPDALARDGMALIEHLGLSDYDLGGYSLGARTAARMVAGGAAPRRLVYAGMGLDGLVDAERRTAFFRDVLDRPGQHLRGTPGWMIEGFLKTTGGDPAAMRLILGSFVSTPPDTIRRTTQQCLVVAGEDDGDNGSAPDLAAALPRGQYVSVPGNHMSAVVKPDLGRAIADFLAG